MRVARRCFPHWLTGKRLRAPPFDTSELKTA
jgi:hypothetical protein